MASTIENTSLLVTVSEQITLNGQAINSVNELTVPDINEFAKRIVSVPSSQEVTLITFATVVGAGSFVLDNVKYLRVTNKDNTNFARLRVKGVSEVFDIKLEAGKSFMMGNVKESANNSGAAFSAFVSAYNITAQADTAPVDVEFVVASI